MAGLRHEEMTYELRGMLFETHNQLRVGWPEEAYHRALVQLLDERGVPVQSKPRRTVSHRGHEVHVFVSDLLVWDTIILELKVLPYTTFVAAHYAQIIHYLKCWSKGLGLLVNFGKRRVEIERVVWDEPKLEVEEYFDSIRPLLADADRSCLSAVRDNLIAIAQQYGLGYPEAM